MLSWKARPKLEAFIAKLRGWETAVPSRATRFHEVRAGLVGQIRAAMPRFWQITFSADDLERFGERVRRLEDVAEPLAALITQTGALQAEVRELAELGADLDPETLTWLRERCDNWTARLERLAAGTERQTDLDKNRADFKRTETEVREHRKAVTELQDADELLAGMSADVRRKNDLRTLALNARLPDFRERLRTLGPSREWSSDLKSLVEPLQTFVETVKDPPAEQKAVGKLLTEARGWARLLGIHEDEVDRQEERRYASLDWTPNELAGMLSDATSLRARLIEHAQQVRLETLRELGSEMDDLLEACGPQPFLEAQLAELRGLEADRPQWFGEWLTKAEQFRSSFDSIAYSHVGVLETRLGETVSALLGRLDALEKQPLSAEIARTVTVLRIKIRTLPDPLRSDRILLRLHHAKEFARHLGELERQAADDFEALDRSEDALIARAKALKAVVARVKRAAVDPEALVHRIQWIRRGPEGGTLAERQEVVAGYSDELDAIEAMFVARCREELTKQMAMIHRALSVLRTAGEALPSFPPPDIPPNAGAQAAADAVVGAVRVLHELNQRARKLVVALEVRAKALRPEVAGMMGDEFVPADREKAERLVHALDSILEDEKKKTLQRLDPLARCIQECDRFFLRLQQDEREARERLADLRRRLQQFRDEQFDEHCAELTDRVSALIEGVPARPRRWSGVRHQLAIAGDVLSRLEIHAARLAADELRDSKEKLKSARRGNPALRAAALAELEALGMDTLPPIDVRRRIRDVVNRLR